MRQLLAAMVLMGMPAMAGGAECGKTVRAADGVSFDLAPPAGWVDVCENNADLCAKLTQAYDPATVTTLAYFVPAAEWPKPAPEPPPGGFTRFLIAQLAPAKKPASLQALKTLIKTQSAVPAAELEEALTKEKQASLGVFDESPSSISFGAAVRREGGVLAMSNTAMVLKDRVLSLYAYVNIASAAQAEQVKALTTAWLACLRQANPS